MSFSAFLHQLITWPVVQSRQLATWRDRHEAPIAKPFVHPRTSFSAFLHQLMAQEQLSILSLANLTPPDALAIVRARLAVPAPDRCVGGLSSPPPI